MQFTPQQLGGGPRYSATTRVGNWYEDISLENAKIEEFQSRSKTGSLQVRKLREKISKCSQLVPHTFSEDGIIRFGDYIILEHDNTGSSLACDPFYELSPGSERYHISASRDASSIARNTFRIIRPPKALRNVEDDETDPILRVGQSFFLGCNETLLISDQSNLLSPQLYVSSTQKNERNATRSSNKQLIYLSTKTNVESVWIVMPPSFGKIGSCERVLSIGSPVYFDDSFVITHKQTNSLLNVNPTNKELTDFGPEFECYCDFVHSTGKLAIMQYEAIGVSTATSLVKADVPNNMWHFVSSKDPDTAVDSRALPPNATVETILDDLYQYARSLGADGFSSLRDKLFTLDKKSSGFDGKLDKEDVKAILLQWGCGLPIRYLDMVLDDIAFRGTFILYKDLLKRIRGPINPNRQINVSDIFNSLDPSSESIFSRFTPSSHPLSGGIYSDTQLLQQFKSYFINNKGKIPDVLKYSDFEEYFADLSAGIDEDDYFNNMVRIMFA